MGPEIYQKLPQPTVISKYVMKLWVQLFPNSEVHDLALPLLSISLLLISIAILLASTTSIVKTFCIKLVPSMYFSN